jgi:hypothetical protein
VIPRVILFAAFTAHAAPPPNRMLWNWFEAVDLRFLKPSDAGVAFRGLSLDFGANGKVAIEPSRTALRLAPGTYEMAVVRVDFDKPTPFSATQRDLAARAIIDLAKVTRVPAIQIDFDAPASARPLYRALLRQVRAGIGRGVFLSITALVSWCGPHSWMEGLDVDEVVPMTFEAGPEGVARVPFPFHACNGSIGISTNGGIVIPRPEQRIYFFPEYQNWTRDEVAEALRKVGK